MLDKVFSATYAAKDSAFALQHGNFSNWRRDQTKAGAFYLPRKASAGPGGGEYLYLHVIEMGFALAIGHTRRPQVARQVFAGFIGLISGNDYLLKKFNALPDDDRLALFNKDWGYVPEDHPILGEYSGQPVRALSDVNVKWLLARPELALGPDIISRDPTDPTFLIYDPHPYKERVSNDVCLIGDIPLSEARNRYFKMRAGNGSDDYAAYVEDDCDDLPIINLTTMFNRIEKRLLMRLQASTIRSEF